MYVFKLKFNELMMHLFIPSLIFHIFVCVFFGLFLPLGSIYFLDKQTNSNYNFTTFYLWLSWSTFPDSVKWVSDIWCLRI